MNIFSCTKEAYTFCELGCTRVVMSFIVSVHSRFGRTVFTKDKNEDRIAYIQLWRASCARVIRASVGPDLSHIHHYLPRVMHNDFTGDDNVQYNHHIKNCRMAFWANDSNGAWTRDNTVQKNLEAKFVDCKVGSMVVALDRMFLGNLM